MHPFLKFAFIQTYMFAPPAELGDYDQRRHSKGYVSEFRLLPNQSNELETRVSELHQQLKGMSPSSAELNYLDKVKWHDMYGVDLHPVLVSNVLMLLMCQAKSGELPGVGYRTHGYFSHVTRPEVLKPQMVHQADGLRRSTSRIKGVRGKCKV